MENIYPCFLSSSSPLLLPLSSSPLSSPPAGGRGGGEEEEERAVALDDAGAEAANVRHAGGDQPRTGAIIGGP